LGSPDAVQYLRWSALSLFAGFGVFFLLIVVRPVEVKTPISDGRRRTFLPPNGKRNGKKDRPNNRI